MLFLDASYWSRKAETGLCEQTGFKIASCRRQPCVPGCFSGHCDLAKPALRPPMFFRRLASNFSVLGGPLTDNVVFVSDQRVFVPKRSAVPRPRIGTGLAEGETGQAKPDWPPKVTGFQNASCRRQPCVPGCFSGHCDLAKPALRPPMFFRRLASNFSVLGGPLTDNVVLNSAQRFLHSRSRSVSYRDDSPSRHPEVLLFRIWAWVSAKTGP